VRTAAVLPPLRVLVADDVPQNLELLQLVMTRRGHTVTGVADGAAAVELAAREEFDLILMDYQMPVMDGLAATRAIREQALAGGRARVPVVAMTASVLPEHRRASADAGMDGFATKPIEWQALSHEIARVLGLAGQAQSAGTLDAAPRQVLNREAGLRRWGGMADAYERSLADFHQAHAGLARELEQLASGGERAQLAALAHKARGPAANLGFEQLADALAALEQGAATPAPLDASLAQLAAAHAAALAECGPRQAENTAAPPPGAADLGRASAAADSLMKALGRGSLDDAALAALVAALGGHAPSAAPLAVLQAALADFDFDLALAQLHTVAGVLTDTTMEAAS
jgi:CheY-like chemotaxis protein